MIFKKDNLILGLVLGFLGPIIGVLIFKLTKLKTFSLKETFQYFFYQPGHGLLTVALSLSLMINAVLFTIYINTRKDRTAKGIFVFTIVYGLIILAFKTFD